MAVKTYGIFLAYPPTVSLRAEGLGRYLAAFVKGATHRGDINLVIATPSWFRQPLQELFDEHGIPLAAIKFVGPETQPLLLTLHQWVGRATRRVVKRPRLHWASRLLHAMRAHARWLSYRIVGSRDPISFAVVILYSAFLLLLASPVILVAFLIHLARRFPNAMQKLVNRGIGRLQIRQRLAQPVRRLLPKGGVQRFAFTRMLEREVEVMVEKANKAGAVAAWYSPTSLWPGFNRLRAPKLACFPDLVFLQFPVAFGAEGLAATSRMDGIRETVEGGQLFVTYSEHVKRSVMMRALGVPSHQVEVVLHGPSSLNSRVDVQGLGDNDAAARSLCLELARQALSNATGPSRGQRFDEVRFDFLFYASQFRPSKNVTTLLRAYEFLLRRRYIGHKLILTGHGDSPDIKRFIRDHKLERDVLFLHGLSEAQLAALYKLADLAVNPTLSEGGMPFTFTEAVSVGTPVVMSDIEVTREVIKDPDLRAATLFDPYDWRSVADKIEWALENKNSLYAMQRKFYDNVLSKRTWEDVVAEHIAILDRIVAHQKVVSA
ncbi:glycosyltransferase [Chelativorans sp. AA-79]|uniref:glycosyltransferase n=1 Tax=Chelativorans sp. AA-79 TaxID=3028735 RepID=UPI0023F6C5C2|nr:glycosyltransferase [Chelativorans sp. AA-79]WEX08342.1 glycosyltransferase [Chelativorans sp. AA-79]